MLGTITLYEFVIAIQILSVCVCSVFVIVMVRQKSNRITKWMLLASIAAFVQNAGYLQELMAKNADEVLLAIRFEYLGGAFSGTFLLLFVLSFYGHKKPKTVFTALFVIDILVVISIWTSSWNPMYYTGVGFDSEAVIPHVVLGKGPLYLFNVPVICIQLFSCIVVAVIHCRHIYDREQKRIGQMILASTLAPGIFYMIGAMYGFEGFDVVPLGVTISVLINAMATIHQRMFNLEINAHENIIETMDEAIIIVDYMYCFVEANQQARRLFPVLESSRKNQSMKELHMDKLLFDRAEKDITLEQRTYHIHINEIRGKKQLEGYVIMLFDITEEHQQMARMQQLKIEADKANRAKSDFLARMSHEIRTPINAVLGMNEMILRESREPAVGSYAKDIQTSAQMLLHIINDILDFSKIESGKMEIIPVEYHLSDLLTDIHKMATVKAAEKQLDFCVRIDPELPEGLIGDDIRIRQILLNLLSNAVKYTAEGSVALEVDGRMNGDTVTLSIRVSDTGIGMKQEELPRLFEAFEGIDVEKNRSVEGTGLGLNICAQLLRLMGSQLMVDSIYGEGSVFSFELEQKITDPLPIGNFEERLEKAAQNSVYRTSFIAPSARILVVDDNKINCKVFTSLLKATKIKIQALSSGRECLDLVKKEHFDMIFLDHMMPEMDGIETLHEMRKLKENACPDTPVIMLTANALTGAREQYMQEGFDDFLSKPVLPENLEAIICKYLPEEYVIRDNLLMMKTDENAGDGDGERRNSAREMPQIEGVDWEYAREHLPDDGLLLQTMENFYESIGQELQKLQETVDCISQPEYLDEYRIRVHSLKGTAALIGVLSVSTLARLSEEAAKEKDRERILQLHPLLVRELELYRERMRVLAEDDVRKEKANPVVILPLLYMLQENLKERDFDGADTLMEKLTAYCYEEDIQEKVDLLRTQVLNLEAEAGIITIEKTMKLITGGSHE